MTDIDRNDIDRNDPLDKLIKQSVERLDSSKGLPSNFAYLMARRAAQTAARRNIRARKRERIMSWAIPTVIAIGAIVAIALVIPGLPRLIMASMSEGTADTFSYQALSIWGLIGSAVVILLLIEGFVRRKLLSKANH